MPAALPPVPRWLRQEIGKLRSPASNSHVSSAASLPPLSSANGSSAQGSTSDLAALSLAAVPLPPEVIENVDPQQLLFLQSHLGSILKSPPKGEPTELSTSPLPEITATDVEQQARALKAADKRGSTIGFRLAQRASVCQYEAGETIGRPTPDIAHLVSIHEDDTPGIFRARNHTSQLLKHLSHNLSKGERMKQLNEVRKSRMLQKEPDTLMLKRQSVVPPDDSPNASAEDVPNVCAASLSVSDRGGRRKTRKVDVVEMVKLQDAFQRYDADKSGTLSFWELRAAVFDVGLKANIAEEKRIVAQLLREALAESVDRHLEFSDFAELVPRLRQAMHEIRREELEGQYNRGLDEEGRYVTSHLRPSLETFGVPDSTGEEHWREALAMLDKSYDQEEGTFATFEPIFNKIQERLVMVRREEDRALARAHNLTEKQLEEFRFELRDMKELFDSFDTDDSGALDEAEVKQLLATTGLESASVLSAFNSLLLKAKAEVWAADATSIARSDTDGVGSVGIVGVAEPIGDSSSATTDAGGSFVAEVKSSPKTQFFSEDSDPLDFDFSASGPLLQEPEGETHDKNFLGTPRSALRSSSKRPSWRGSPIEAEKQPEKPIPGDNRKSRVSMAKPTPSANMSRQTSMNRSGSFSGSSSSSSLAQGTTCTFKEFLMLVRHVRARNREEQRESLESVFKHYDCDRSGQIQIKEISKLLSDCGMEPKTREEQMDIRAIFDDVDANGDETFEFSEFEVLMQRIQERINRLARKEEERFATELGFDPTRCRELREMFAEHAEAGDARPMMQVAGLRAVMDAMQRRYASEQLLDLFQEFGEAKGGIHSERLIDAKGFLRLMAAIEISKTHGQVEMALMSSKSFQVSAAKRASTLRATALSQIASRSLSGTSMSFPM